VLGGAFGLAALFLYLGTIYNNTTGATVTILFGSPFALTTSVLPLVAVFGALALGAVLLLYRPLLLVSVSPELASARRLPVRLVGSLYLLAMALAMALSAVTIGAILSAALLIGPAATALQLTCRPGRAIATAGLLGVGAMWLGILLAYDSYYWPPIHHGWPVSFFVVSIVLVGYVASRTIHLRERGR
jgi:zinc/manganese transport system permease protein